MHFSKTYAQLLLSLPQELRDNAIQYRQVSCLAADLSVGPTEAHRRPPQLKKLINKVVNELAALGLQPSVLHELLTPGHGSGDAASVNSDGVSLSESTASSEKTPKVIYEFSSSSDSIEPRLRLWVKGHQAEPLDFSASVVNRTIPSYEDEVNYINLVSPRCV